MTLNVKTSISMAICLAGSVTTAPIPSSLSLHNDPRSGHAGEASMSSTPDAECPREFSLYKGVSDRPLGWKVRRKVKPVVGQVTRDANIRRWDGRAGTSSEWDGLRRDPELWYSEGDCLVYLYGHGQSKRGPAFKVPLEALLCARFRPLVNRFLVQDFDGSPISESSSIGDADWERTDHSARYELYIPVPPTAEHGQALIHHIATRNLFAWIFNKPLVGPHLGGAFVALLNLMNEFRSAGSENIGDILEYLDEQGYADMRSRPDQALAILYFAEHFEYRDIWIDAYAHCAGMDERLFESSEFKHISRKSRNLIRRGRLEMDIRLDRCGSSLSTFMEDELSAAHLGLSPSVRDHLDRFRAFLQSYYVKILGYYPPPVLNEGSSAFPKHVYEMMVVEFQNLYEFLADEKFTSQDSSPLPAQGGICVLQNIQAFDQRQRHQSLPHPLPLLPQTSWDGSQTFKGRMSWTGKPNKSKVEERLLRLSSLAKASNRCHADLLECSLVRSFCVFEKEHFSSRMKAEKFSKVSLVDARKAFWIMIYAMLQTLRAVTVIPDEVRDTEDVPYNICLQTAGCPPWQDEIRLTGSWRKPKNEVYQDCDDSSLEDSTSASSTPYTENREVSTAIKPDIDYFQLSHQLSPPTTASAQTSQSTAFRKTSVRRALSRLGNMPELRHPRPVRNSFHEFLVLGYGNGPNNVSLNASTTPAPELLPDDGNSSSDSLTSTSYSDSALVQTSLHWSSGNVEVSPPSSISDTGNQNAEANGANWKGSEIPGAMLMRKANGTYSARDEMELSHLRPEPLDISRKISLMPWVEI